MASVGERQELSERQYARRRVILLVLLDDTCSIKTVYKEATVNCQPATSHTPNVVVTHALDGAVWVPASCAF